MDPTDTDIDCEYHKNIEPEIIQRETLDPN